MNIVAVTSPEETERGSLNGITRLHTDKSTISGSVSTRANVSDETGVRAFLEDLFDNQGHGRMLSRNDFIN